MSKAVFKKTTVRDTGVDMAAWLGATFGDGLSSQACSRPWTCSECWSFKGSLSMLLVSTAWKAPR